MEVRAYGKTDTGRVREHNEDNILVAHEKGIFVVCDGMGGHASGEVASFYACEVIKDICITKNVRIEGDSCRDINMLPEETQLILTAIRLANQRIYLESTQIPERKGMGTTVAAIYLNEKGYASIINVGDSRVYRLRDGSIKQLTKDHTWMNELLEDKEISEKDLANFRQKNVLTRALGIGLSVKIDVHIEPIKNGDIFLICSDGLSGLVSLEEIEQIIKDSQDDFKKAGDRLINTANNRGGTDNISVILVGINGLREATTIIPSSYTVQETDAVIQTLQKVAKRYYKIKTKKNRFLALSIILGIFLFVVFVYLALGPHNPSTPKITVSKLEVESDPQGALLILNGQKIGITPFTIESLTPAQKYNIVLNKEGYVSYSESVYLSDSFESRFIRLKPIAILKITYCESKTGDADLLIDSKLYDKLRKIENHEIGISDGTHQITAVLDGREIFSQEIKVEKGFVIEVIPDESKPRQINIKREE